MKVSMLVECETVCELQNTILQMADFCSLTVDEGPIPYALAEEKQGVATNEKAEPKNTTPKVAATVATVKAPAATYTLEQVRDIMSNLPTAKVRELMLDFGVKKLTDLNAENYPELVAKAGAGA